MAQVKLGCYTGPWGPDGFVQAISCISSHGFEGIECPASIVQQYEDRLHVFEEILQCSNLKLASLYQQLDLLDGEKADEQVERAANSARFGSAAGAKTLTIIHAKPHPEPMTEEEWATLGAIVEEIGERCAEFDVHLCFSPRASGPVSSSADVKRLLLSTKEKFVKLALDTAEFCLGGTPPPKAIKAFGDRIGIVRFRDASASKRSAKPRSERPRTTPQFGRGAIDFEAVSKALMAEHYAGWILLDVTGEAHAPAEAVAAGYRFLLRKSGLFL